MLTQTERPSSRLLAFTFVIVAVGMASLAVRSTGSEARSTNGGSAELTVARASYEFNPSACSVTETDFLVAGAGQIDGEDFWISVSPESVEVAFGTSDARTRSEDADDLWLMGDVDWESDGETVRANLTMRSERVADAAPLLGRFNATCTS